VRGVPVGEGSYLSDFAVIRGECSIGPNVLVAQRAFLENAELEKGANAQENCYIIDSKLEEMDITAHGGKVIKAHLGPRVFTGFNSLVRGGEKAPLKVGAETIIMPHTIIDLVEPLEIPARSLVWGFIQNQADLKHNSISLDQLTEADYGLEKGGMRFTGKGSSFVSAFEHRLHHILEANGAFYDGLDETRGHAQMSQKITYNVLQPYAAGELIGMHPSIAIKP
jgi:carbonic anhydrase/acetyltransferase-like protein (isoleucine patch superfamily)